MSNVVRLFPKRVEKATVDWAAQFDSMDMLELLEQMVGFQERRLGAGEFPPEMIAEGIALFGALERRAETIELRKLTGAYRKRLEEERDAG